MCTQVVAHGIQECAHFIILLCSTSAHYAMKCAYKMISKTHQLKYIFIYITIGFGLGILQSPPLIYALSSVHHVPYTTKFQKSSKRCGYSSHIASSCSQVASSGPYQVHWTFTIPMARFHSCLIFWSKMRTRYTWKVPSCST
jgi:hypothetical protein